MAVRIPHYPVGAAVEAQAETLRLLTRPPQGVEPEGQEDEESTMISDEYVRLVEAHIVERHPAMAHIDAYPYAQVEVVCARCGMYAGTCESYCLADAVAPGRVRCSWCYWAPDGQPECPCPGGS